MGRPWHSVRAVLLGSAALTTLTLGETTQCEDISVMLQVKAEPTDIAELSENVSSADETSAGLEVFDSGVMLPGLDKVHYEPAFLQKCLGQWQDKCRADFAHDKESDKLLCESHLNRVYLKSRFLVPKEHVRAHFDHSESALQGRNQTVYEGLRLPKFTEEGFTKSHVPASLHERFVTWFEAERRTAQPENPPVLGKWCNNDYDNDDFVLAWGNTDIGRKLVDELKALLVPQLREWTQVELDDNPVIYGVRMYHRGSICAMHTDDSSDHIISAIYHLSDRGLQDDWPLNVIDHGGHERSILSKPGDLTFYESASTPHGRKGTLVGDEFSNIFFHFKPKGWEEQRKAARLSMLPYQAHEHFTAPILAPATFHSGDKCLPYGTGNFFAGAFNTSVMRLPFTHLGGSADP